MATFEEKCKAAMTKVFDAVGADPVTGMSKEQVKTHLLHLVATGTSLPGIHMPDDPEAAIDQNLEAMFFDADADKNGLLTLDEIWAKQGPDMNSMPPEVQTQVLMMVEMYCDLLAGVKEKSGAERFEDVRNKLKSAFDAVDKNGNGVLDKEELKAGCMEMAKGISKMSGMPVESMESEMNESVDNLLASIPGGNVTFDAMFALAMPGICQGQDPATFFSSLDPVMYQTINLQIDMYLGGLVGK